ncbi:zona pellucida sperm-binding protein 3-like [Synchiropus splendidus]|uniref:zona pellucida sperm-binding protein 3-like n=1 Tax=Synchiropus splendidus TaxID=270530 RepID=UPI00237D4614|nr:zona pellucida sperm-binding protein 3-like [Synchiropus splendidus]XP_053741230.1 zona pellucida sperm-binding protein 3-like [Synchiropus splendidus]XP_053741232.1 zona pellucida sperm-binding protein 3-like [Synchiropus splendidus]XP_053741233.1 zona pellucida sperm-binding protein 3-like [Synchiropus splendidus]XP_053741234.1 zona pellucida sperm-binding protein 3-like [Synchiropus splendidus]XP_053741235.1 zona pellucida sperm-binding protein 3-like [Synchiropus splendidus]XP_05374123
MAMNWSAVCLLALALCSSFSDAQWPNFQQPSKPQRQEPTKQMPKDPQQSKQSFEAPLTWTYPEDPKPEPQPEVPFELRHPVPAATVAVECRESVAHVEVKKDMFGINQFINPADLTLGNCPVVAEDSSAHVLIYESELHNCQSVLTMTEESLIYSFTLNYNPMPIGDSPVVRTSKAAVIVECHYPRKHNVSSLPLDPLWIPFSTIKVAEEFLYFTLKLMTGDWMFERPSYQYFLGDMINIEATVMQYFHVPLRVYVDSCVATLSPEMNSSPRYAFIENNGCLVDSRITGSKSQFMARAVQNKLQFQLEAFRFQGADSGVLFITCHLRASSAAHAVDSDHRACSYVNLGWREASGIDSACGSCESSSFGPAVTTSVASPGVSASGGSWTSGSGLSHTGRKVRDVSESAVFEWEGDVTLGPIPIGEKVIS